VSYEALLFDYEFILYIERDLDSGYVLVPSFQQVCLMWRR
jgi:hypothetical protein